MQLQVQLQVRIEVPTALRRHRVVLSSIWQFVVRVRSLVGVVCPQLFKVLAGFSV
jgi:hypothetical protein